MLYTQGVKRKIPLVMHLPGEISTGATSILEEQIQAIKKPYHIIGSPILACKKEISEFSSGGRGTLPERSKC